MANVLVTGGAGYIGSHAVLALREAGHKAVVLDNLATGCRYSVPPDVSFVHGNIADAPLVKALLTEHTIDSVMHFAGSSVVPESVTDPLKYYHNNSAGSCALIRACVDIGVGNFIFSSTAAVYGSASAQRVTEDCLLSPESPYGRSKLITEWFLQDTAAAHPNFNYVALRYFNVAGADPAGRIGQSTPNATHLIKVASEAAAGLREHVAIFGQDYDTSDGTCVRDYIHVADLVDAHLLVLEYLQDGGNSQVFNCGYGRGYSVLQVLEAVQRLTNTKLKILHAPRRAGDMPVLVADATRIRQHLGWKPNYDDLETIVETAVAWERSLSGIAVA